MLSNLLKQLEQVTLESNNKINSVKELIQVEYDKIFDDMLELQQAIKILESEPVKNNYYIDLDGFVSKWTRLNLKLNQNEIEYLNVYLQEYCMSYDSKNEALEQSCGPELLVYNDCVFDLESHKRIIEIDKDMDDQAINNAIKDYQEKIGYYQGVFNSDRYGNLTLRDIS